eukprot:s3318_g12.t1
MVPELANLLRASVQIFSPAELCTQLAKRSAALEPPGGSLTEGPRKPMTQDDKETALSFWVCLNSI